MSQFLVQDVFAVGQLTADQPIAMDI